MSEATSETRPADQGISTPALTEGTPAATEDFPTPISRDEDPNSKKVTLADLSARGTALYAHKQYEEATEIFSRASVLQAEINGETAPENAEILFHYGRSLFKVGQSKSDVLGGPSAAEKKKPVAKASGSKPAEVDAAKTEAQKVTQEGDSAAAADAGSTGDKKEEKPKDGGPDEKKPLFQFTGDENFDGSSDEEPQEAPEEEEEDDDLATAFEILDLARVCYEKQLENLSTETDADKGKKPVEEDSSAIRHIKERLADTHDCLAEISLENERYPNAIEDGRVSLKYKLELYPEDSEIIAEAHYKMSLALEFASVTMSGDDGTNTKREAMDQDLRDQAVKHMELAIKSFKLKMQNKEVDVATMASPEDNDLARKAIGEMKEVIADMEQRLVDLKKDPIDAADLLGGAEGNALGGLFGAALGESAAETQARVEEAKKTATDLTGLVRKKKPTQEQNGQESKPDLPAPATNGKRKAEDDAPEAAESPKKAKVEEPVPATEEVKAK